MAHQEDPTSSADPGVPDFWPEALEVIDSAPIGLLATTEGLQPHVRPVAPAYVGLHAYVLTSVRTPKLEQIRSNERVEILHWTVDFRHLNLAGIAEVTEDHHIIAEVAPHFPYAVDDFFGPDLRAPALIKIALQRISITTFDDIIANKRPRIWRISD
ncbi:MAG: pyridoxamine 5'-phosphate oxidase family protein [Chloroflexi bacterium]|nr:pyridoxamine 5'-phosphate oxidase family protein [Chloroflexota bacterium]